jgi:hypothetical protein
MSTRISMPLERKRRLLRCSLHPAGLTPGALVSHNPGEARELVVADAALNFGSVAEYLQHPLVLVGFVVFVVSGFLRAFLASDKLGQASSATTGRILFLIARYGFLLALLVILLDSASSTTGNSGDAIRNSASRPRSTASRALEVERIADSKGRGYGRPAARRLMLPELVRPGRGQAAPCRMPP